MMIQILKVMSYLVGVDSKTSPCQTVHRLKNQVIRGMVKMGY